MTHLPQMEQWCAREGLWLSHFWHVRFHPSGVVGRLVRGTAPGEDSMARACDASAREAHKLKTKKLWLSMVVMALLITTVYV
jgi:hypothetical protein